MLAHFFASIASPRQRGTVLGHVPTGDTLQHTVHPHGQNIVFPSFCPDYAISKPDLMSQMERGERPAMQEQEDSEEGETPTDPSAGEWQMRACVFHCSGSSSVEHC